MGRSDLWMRRLFALVLAAAVVGSTSWFVIPAAARALADAQAVIAGMGLRPPESVIAGEPPPQADLPAVPPVSGARPGASQPSAGPTPTPAADSAAGEGVPEGPGATPRPGFWNGTVFLPPAEGYVWPLVGAKLTTYFAPARGGSMVLAGQTVHNGLDLARPCWTPIRAAHDGTVIYAGRRADPHLGFSGSVQPYYDELARRKLTSRALPIMVVIDDGNGLLSVYAHLIKTAVKAGDAVEAREAIGYEGATGNATGCHLHYSLIVADGPWVEVAPLLVEKWHYPRYMRLRVDPLLYLPADSPDAPFPRPGLAPPEESLVYVGHGPSPVDVALGTK